MQPCCPGAAPAGLGVQDDGADHRRPRFGGDAGDALADGQALRQLVTGVDAVVHVAGLIKAALDGGGPDNVTVIVVDVA